jgi:peptide/nickel transport system ATP-binding protein
VVGARRWGRWQRPSTPAVQGVSFDLQAGRTFGLVGESGCGKSTVARMVAGLLRPDQGLVLLEGLPLHATLAKEPAGQLRRQVQMVFQDPMGSLDPRWTIERIVAEPLMASGAGASKAVVAERVAWSLARVGLSAGDASKFPHQFSGGQRQRIAIARALVSQPRLLICDEPTSALDVSVQAQVLNLMKDVQRDLGTAYLFISHNLAVVRHMADEVGVMHQGRLVEQASAERLFAQPRHPYTRMLLEAVPDMRRMGLSTDLNPPTVPGVSSAGGCPFQPRCPVAVSRCRLESPRLMPEPTEGRWVACHVAQHAR